MGKKLEIYKIDPPSDGSPLECWREFRRSLNKYKHSDRKRTLVREADCTIGAYESGRSIDLGMEEFESWIPKLLAAAKRRAVAKGLPFELTKSQVISHLNKSGWVCAVSGLRFTSERFDNALVKHPFGPSIDRIDPALGYTKSNCRVVCAAVNFAMNQWGADVLGRVAHGMMAPVFDYEDDLPDIEYWYQTKRWDRLDAEKAFKLAKGKKKQAAGRRLAAIRASITKGPIRQKRIWKRIQDK